MTIKKICIENVRGIRQLMIEDQILQNRPTILVAPNGFGKTSIATAFKSAIEKTSIQIEDEDRYEHNPLAKAKIELTYEDNQVASVFKVEEKAHSNDIRKHFDINVICDLRIIKATTPWTPTGQAKPKGKSAIEPITICPIIRKKPSPFTKTMFHAEMGKHKGVLPDINAEIFACRDFVMRAADFIEQANAILAPNKYKKIEGIKNQLTSHAGTTEEALSSISSRIEALAGEDGYRQLFEIIQKTTLIQSVPSFFAIWQILALLKISSESLIDHLQWRRYSEVKKSLEDGLKKLSLSSWKAPSTKETKGSLVVELPDPTYISNGQRDILVLLSLLHIARYNATKSKSILIIDEVFDYLDDANITVAQYYLSQLIEDYKQQGRSIYVLLLTHLNPSFFRNYVFSTQKVVYLDNGATYKATDAMKKLLNARKDNKYAEELKSQIAKYLVHYHIDQYNFSQELAVVSGTKSTWGKIGNFQSFIHDEYQKFCTDQPYDPLAICAITRRRIEEKAFTQISKTLDASKFFTTHMTAPKLDFATQQGAVVPESHYLLRVIFDDGLHWNEGRDNMIPIVAKLSHPIIKSMIMEAVG